MRISRVNWGEVNEGRPSWSPATGHLYAIWPSPVDHDQCFEAAGFTDFGDTDGAWQQDSDDLVRRLVDALGGAGAATLKDGESPVDGWRTRGPVCEALAAAANDDRFPPCVVHLGQPATASIRTNAGHAILWIWMADSGIGRIVAAVGQGREVNQTQMKWEKLA